MNLTKFALTLTLAISGFSLTGVAQYGNKPMNVTTCAHIIHNTYSDGYSDTRAKRTNTGYIVSFAKLTGPNGHYFPLKCFQTDNNCRVQGVLEPLRSGLCP